MKYILIISSFIFFSTLKAQIVIIEPTFATENDDITIYYDATKGSAGLIDVNQVYIHTGIITTNGGPGNWMNVQGNWGTDDANVKMINEGNNIHSISFNITDYYSVETNQEVVELGMVFRNVDGSKEGKTETFSDIFVPIYSEGSELLGKFITPEGSNFIVESNTSVPTKLAFSKNVELSVKDNDVTVFEGMNDKDFEFNLENLTEGNHELVYTATSGSEMITESINFIVNPETIPSLDDPDNLPYGLNRLTNNSIRLKLFAPLKDYVYVIGDFNNWNPNAEGLMNRSIDGNYYWIDILNLEATGSYSYQYYVDGSIKIADPYSTIVLDSWNDQYIQESTYPNLPTFPESTQGIVTYFEMELDEFNWTDNSFEKPEKTRLNIYELMMRDFLDDHSYDSLKDSLSYLKALGINAIELMPVQEFEGNQSWGYNPSFHMALDKYYGSAESFKKVVNAAHELDIAVILDVVYNHAFSQNPYAQLYWENNKPSPQSPFFNVDAKHPFNVGSDFNHESQATKDYVKQTSSYWIEEFHIDGFRFDLSKGFTQKQSNDNGPFSAYDQSRVDILSDYANHLWNIDPSFYIILEHFAANNEEKTLSEKGMMLWNNANYNFNEATMGYTSGGKSNFGHISYKIKGWDDAHAIGYMESHDEERLQFKNITYGSTNSTYDVKDPEIGYDRIGMAAAFFFSIPGPKMIWQFGELGYDFSINRCENGTISEDCRLSPKPIRWDYHEEEGRKELNFVHAALMKLRAEEETMHTDNFSLNVSAAIKTINLSGDKDVYLIGNFGVSGATAPANFSHNGIWYEYFSGDSLLVDDNTNPILLKAGEYRMYWDSKLETPQTTNIINFETLAFNLYPNPSNGDQLHLITEEENASIKILDISGKLIISSEIQNHEIQMETNLSNGVYFVIVQHENKIGTKKWIVQN